MVDVESAVPLLSWPRGRYEPDAGKAEPPSKWPLLFASRREPRSAAASATSQNAARKEIFSIYNVFIITEFQPNFRSPPPSTETHCPSSKSSTCRSGTSSEPQLGSRWTEAQTRFLRLLLSTERSHSDCPL